MKVRLFQAFDREFPTLVMYSVELSDGKTYTMGSSDPRSLCPYIQPDDPRAEFMAGVIERTSPAWTKTVEEPEGYLLEASAELTPEEIRIVQLLGRTDQKNFGVDMTENFHDTLGM